MMKKHIPALFALLLIGMLPAAHSAAQNSLGVSSVAELDLEGSLLVGGTASFTIAGVLEIGALAEHQAVSASPKTNSIGFVYAVSALRQGYGFPFTVRIGGSYRMMWISSQLLEQAGLARTGRGFTVGASLIRDFEAGAVAAFRLGADVEYAAYRYENTRTTASADPADDPPDAVVQADGLTRWRFGGHTGVVVKFSPGLRSFLLCSVLLCEGEPVIRPELGLTLIQ